jgi:transposase
VAQQATAQATWRDHASASWTSDCNQADFVSEQEKRRLDAVMLVDSGVSQAEVARQYRVSREAVRKWVNAYRRGGREALVHRPSPGAPPKVSLSRLADLREALERCATGKELCDVISRELGVNYHPSHARRIMRRLRQRPTSQVSQTSPELLRTRSA